MPSRSRYRLLLAAIVVVTVYLISPLRHNSVSISASSAIHWSHHSTSDTKDAEGRPLAAPKPKPKPQPQPESPRARLIEKARQREAEKARLLRLEAAQEQQLRKQTQLQELKMQRIRAGDYSGTDGAAHQAYQDPGARVQFFGWGDQAHPPKPARPKPPYKPQRPAYPPVPDPFPLLSAPLEELARVRRYLRATGPNAPPEEHVPEQTPLLIGFTRNWPQLVQCVASYIAAGWPASDIWVVENTGSMFANRDGKLTLQNPFYLNHTQLEMLGVNVLITPTLLSFAQLQNYYAWTALSKNWETYFWSHQDLLVFSYEKAQPDGSPAQSIYARAVTILRYLRQPGVPKWANHFFAYDHLTLSNRDAILSVGGWDTHIPYYSTDCDMYDRLMWAGYWQGETPVGLVMDVSTVLDDVAALFRVPGAKASFAGDPGPKKTEEDEEEEEEEEEVGEEEEEGEEIDYEDAADEKGAGAGLPNPSDSKPPVVDGAQGETYRHLLEVGLRMQAAKYTDGGGWRNAWQLRQTGGEGEPFHRDPEGFEIGLRMIIEAGRRVFAEKWGHRGCDLARMGIKGDDAWRLEKDWDPLTEGSGSDGDGW